MLLAHEANAALPPSGRVVQDVVDLEPVREHRDQVIELDAEQDIVLVDVGVDERELGRVAGVEERVARDLQHGRDSSSTSDHANLRGEGGCVLELPLGTLDADLVADFEEGEVAGDVALFVSLSQRSTCQYTARWKGQ